MKELISKQAAMDAIDEWWTNPDDYRHPTDVIQALPFAQQEIVHCEECAYRKNNFMGDWCTCWCGWTSTDGYCHKGNRFCAYAERTKNK